MSTGLSFQPLSAARSRRYQVPLIVVIFAVSMTVQWLRVRLRMRTAGVIMIVVTVITSSLAGCAESTASSPVLSAEPSATFSPARVSYTAVCLDLIKQVNAGADLVHEFINDPQRLANGGAATTARFDAMIGGFEHYSSIAPTPLVSHINKQIEEMRYLRDYLHVGGTRNNDFQEYKASGIEIINQCVAAVPSTTPSSTPSIPAAQPAPSGPVTSFGAGTYVVGTDIVPGIYKSAGPVNTALCYWARLRDTSGELSSIIANNNISGPTTVTIKSTDGAFQTSRCATWNKLR